MVFQQHRELCETKQLLQCNVRELAIVVARNKEAFDVAM
jgi:hypothetical protein